MSHAHNHSTWEVEAEGSTLVSLSNLASSRPPGLHETLSEEGVEVSKREKKKQF